MFITIDTILKDHGMTSGGGSKYAGFVEVKRTGAFDGTTLPLPTSHYNPARDACLLFVNGVYLRPGSDYTITRGEEVTFSAPYTDSTAEFVILKTVKPEAPLTNGAWIEDGSVFLKKMTAAFLAKLTDPAQKAAAQAKVDVALADLDLLSKEFAAIELFWNAQSRVSGGNVFGDDFRSKPLALVFDDTRSTLVSATNSGSASVLVVNATGFRVGQEVTLYDNSSYERRRITAVTNNTLSLDSVLTQNYKAGAVVCRSTAKRNEEAKRLDLDAWTDPSTGSTFQLGTYDVRYILPENDRIVTWTETTGANVDVKVAYPSAFDMTVQQTNSPSPYINWQSVTPASVRFEVTASGGTPTSTVALLNGKTVASFGSGTGVFTYALDPAVFAAGENVLRFITTAGGVERSADLKVFKTPVENYAQATLAVKGNETQATIARADNLPAVIRYTLTRKDAGITPTLKRILGGFDRL